MIAAVLQLLEAAGYVAAVAGSVWWVVLKGEGR